MTPATPDAEGLIRELADRLLHHHKMSCEARKPAPSNFQKNSTRCTCGLDFLLERAAAYRHVDHGAALAKALRELVASETDPSRGGMGVHELIAAEAALAAYDAAPAKVPA